MKKIFFFTIIVMIVSCNDKLSNKELEPVLDKEIKYRASTLSDVDAFAVALKEEILNSKTEIAFSFNSSYYVSNNGNDSNDGKITWKGLGYSFEGF
jgi:hypothetical protein